MSSTLVTLVAGAQDISKMLIESGGEITPEIEARLVANETKFPQKVESYVYQLRHFEMYAADFKAKAEEFARIAKTFEYAIEYMEERLKFAASELQLKEFVGIDHKISIIPSKPSVVIEDESKIDQLYIKEKITKSVDKTKIAEDLKMGIPVPGARLQEGNHVKVSINRKALK